MLCQSVITTTGYITCDAITPVGIELPGFYSLLLENKRIRVINGDYIIEVVEGERILNRPLITAITF